MHEHLSECMPHSPQKKHMYPCMRDCATVQKLLCHGSHCELILSLVQASCRLSLPLALAARLAVSTKLVARRCPLKKSVQIHASSWRGPRCGVAQALFDHLRWCRPHWHPVCLWVALEAWPRRSPITEICFYHFFAGFDVHEDEDELFVRCTWRWRWIACKMSFHGILGLINSNRQTSLPNFQGNCTTCTKRRNKRTNSVLGTGVLSRL